MITTILIIWILISFPACCLFMGMSRYTDAILFPLFLPFLLVMPIFIFVYEKWFVKKIYDHEWQSFDYRTVPSCAKCGKDTSNAGQSCLR